MREFVATFHTHLAALQTSRSLTAQGIAARQMPVPRKLSASCGTCVSYQAETPCYDAMAADTESVFEKTDRDHYALLRQYE